MKNIIDALHGLLDAAVLTNIADIELQLVVVVRDPHFLLLFFVAAENAYLPHIGGQKTLEHSVPERPGSTGNHQHLVVKHFDLRSVRSVVVCAHGFNHGRPDGRNISGGSRKPGRIQ